MYWKPGKGRPNKDNQLYKTGMEGELWTIEQEGAVGEHLAASHKGEYDHSRRGGTRPSFLPILVGLWSPLSTTPRGDWKQARALFSGHLSDRGKPAVWGWG